jgi:2'-hydroxyisoflavone reductase
MRLLVIGGTVFVGRAVVEAALGRGDEVTVFHRGHHGRDLFEGVEHVFGDRRTDLDRLAGRSWDVVVDTCGFEPADVEASARTLADAVGRYVFISTAGVYRDWPVEPIADEDEPLHESGDGYSELKAACERALEAVLPGRVAQLRPGTIVGPYENIGRLPHWLWRMARGGQVMAPGVPDAPIQLIDVRDLADFALDAAPGAWNTISRPGAATWGELLETARAVAGPDAELVWTDAAPVLEAVPDPWGVLPLWPAPLDDMRAVFDVGVERTLAAGLRIRPLQETVADTWAWLSQPGTELGDWRKEVQVTGLDPAVEARLLRR